MKLNIAAANGMPAGKGKFTGPTSAKILSKIKRKLGKKTVKVAKLQSY